MLELSKKNIHKQNMSNTALSLSWTVNSCPDSNQLYFICSKTFVCIVVHTWLQVSWPSNMHRWKLILNAEKIRGELNKLGMRKIDNERRIITKNSYFITEQVHVFSPLKLLSFFKPEKNAAQLGIRTQESHKNNSITNLKTSTNSFRLKNMPVSEFRPLRI